MNHKNIKKKLLLYIDNELSHQEMIEVTAHIDICPDCRKHITGLSALWRSEKPEKREVPQYIWTRLAVEIRAYEQDPVPFDIFSIRKKFAHLMQPALIAAVIFMSVITGYYGGDILSKNMDINPDISTREHAAKVFYLDELEPTIIAYNVNEEVVLQ